MKYFMLLFVLLIFEVNCIFAKSVQVFQIEKNFIDQVQEEQSYIRKPYILDRKWKRTSSIDQFKGWPSKLSRRKKKLSSKMDLLRNFMKYFRSYHPKRKQRELLRFKHKYKQEYPFGEINESTSSTSSTNRTTNSQIKNGYPQNSIHSTIPNIYEEKPIPYGLDPMNSMKNQNWKDHCIPDETESCSNEFHSESYELEQVHPVRKRPKPLSLSKKILQVLLPAFVGFMAWLGALMMMTSSPPNQFTPNKNGKSSNKQQIFIHMNENAEDDLMKSEKDELDRLKDQKHEKLLKSLDVTDQVLSIVERSLLLAIRKVELLNVVRGVVPPGGSTGGGGGGGNTGGEILKNQLNKLENLTSDAQKILVEALESLLSSHTGTRNVTIPNFNVISTTVAPPTPPNSTISETIHGPISTNYKIPIGNRLAKFPTTNSSNSLKDVSFNNHKINFNATKENSQYNSSESFVLENKRIRESSTGLTSKSFLSDESRKMDQRSKEIRTMKSQIKKLSRKQFAKLMYWFKHHRRKTQFNRNYKT